MGNRIVCKKIKIVDIGIPWDVVEEHVLCYLDLRDLVVFSSVVRRKIADRTKNTILFRKGIVYDGSDWILRCVLEKIISSKQTISDKMVKIITLGYSFPETRLKFTKEHVANDNNCIASFTRFSESRDEGNENI